MKLDNVLKLELSSNKNRTVPASKVFLRTTDMKEVKTFKQRLSELRDQNKLMLIDKRYNRSIDILDEETTLENILISA